MRAFVTGSAGFVGRYLVKFLLDKGYEVSAAYHRERPSDSVYAGCRLEEADINKRETLKYLLNKFQPDEVYHLAAVAVTTGQDRDLFYKVNFSGSINLFEAIRDIVPNARVLFVGSANTYGLVPAEKQPVTEDQPLSPVNHYASSKAAADLAACAYSSDGMRVVRARPFNHTGPGQTTDYVCSRLARHIAEISLGLRKPVLEAGNLAAARDFTDVRDVVRAYWLLLQMGETGEVYNVCSQSTYAVRDIISILTEAAGIEIEVVTDSSLLRKNDIPVLVGSREKIYKVTGWEPAIAFKQTLTELLDCWRQELLS